MVCKHYQNLRNQMSFKNEILHRHLFSWEALSQNKLEPRWGPFDKQRKARLEEKNCCQKQPPEVFYKKGVLRNLTKFASKNLC